jgi:hypothetical protein
VWGYLLFTIIALLAIFSIWQNKLPPMAVLDMIRGIVYDNPQDLADAAGVDLETYSLARVGQSEEGISSDRAKLAVMCATRNHAERSGKTITEVVTRGNPKRSDYADANGRYGRQGIHPYCTTIAAPTSNTLALAATVIDGTAVDETQGAQWWDNPRAQDALALAMPKNTETGTGYYTSAEIAERRQSKGAKMVVIDGISTRFWV